MRPFPYEKYPLIHYMDNTKGQIIDFDKWLNKYPNHINSYGYKNHNASPKHCISVEKCMELIPEDFILLDSDILLKKDISNIINKNALCAADIIYHQNLKTYRATPFLCYINTPLCRQKNIHFFNENYMHGLGVSKESEKHDTGGAFYLATKHNFVKIIIDNYIIHYGAGSWGNKIDEKKWIEKNSMIWK